MCWHDTILIYVSHFGSKGRLICQDAFSICMPLRHLSLTWSDLLLRGLILLGNASRYISHPYIVIIAMCSLLAVKMGKLVFPLPPLSSKRKKQPTLYLSALSQPNYVRILLNKPQLGEFMKWAKPLIMVSESQR